MNHFQDCFDVVAVEIESRRSLQVEICDTIRFFSSNAALLHHTRSFSHIARALFEF